MWESVQLELEGGDAGLDEKRKTALEWESPYYKGEVRRGRASARALAKDEEEGSKIVGEPPKAGWM